MRVQLARIVFTIHFGGSGARGLVCGLLAGAIARFVAAFALLACAPPSHPTPGGIAVTGVRLPAEQMAWIDTAHASVRQCLRAHGFAIVDQVKEVRVHPGEWFTPPGYSAPVKGYPVGDRVEVTEDLSALRHEFAASLTRNDSHATDGTAPAIVCEHAGPRPPSPIV